MLHENSRSPSPESDRPTAATQDKITLAAGCDENFAFPLAVTMFGAVSNLRGGRAVEIYIVDGGILPATQAKLRRVVEAAGPQVTVKFVTPNFADLADVPLANIGVMTYLRLLLPELLPAEIEHVLYLDSDLAILGDLSEIWSFVPLETSIAGCRDLSSPRVSSTRALCNWRELGLDAEAPYVNAGLLLMNLTRWRTEGLAKKIVDYNRRTADINWYADQDGINALLCSDVEVLPVGWNVPALLESNELSKGLDDPLSAELIGDRRACLAKAKVIHYLGSRKPWKPGLGLRCQWAWLDQARRSGWFASRIDYWRFVSPIAADYIVRRIGRRLRAKM